MSNDYSLEESFDFNDAAKKLAISVKTLRALVKDKKISHVMVGKRVRFTQEHINAYIKNNTVNAS